MTAQNEIQLGKKGLTKEFLEDLEKRFGKSSNKTIKIHVLRSARDSKEDVKKYARKIKEKLGERFTCRVIGFTIVIKKWRRANLCRFMTFFTTKL